MERDAKPAKSKVDTSSSVTGKSRKAGDSKRPQIEQRLTEALEQRAAMSEILRVISSSRTDAQPVFDTIAANALRLCDARFSAVFSFDGELIHMAAFQDLSPEGTAAFRSAFPCRPSRGGTTQRAILTRSIVHMPDIRDEPEYAYQNVAQKADFRSVLSVPMLRDGEVIGTITVYRDAAKPFPDAQIELLKTFADQAVIAVENVRLFIKLGARNRELTDSLTQQTATAEILRVISGSPTNIQPVLDAVAESAARLCEASDASIFRMDGDQLRLAAHHGPIPYGLVGEFTVPLVRGTIGGRTVLDKQTVHVADVQAETKEFPEASRYGWRFGTRTSLSVPLMREGIAIGTIHLRRTEARLFTDRQIALLQTFADQAVIAIENTRLFKELEARNVDLTEALEQQTATSDILRVISQSPTDVQPVFDTIASAALTLCRASAGLVFTFDGDLIHLAAIANMNPQAADAWRNSFPRPPSRDTAATRAVLTCSVVAIPDALEDPEYVLGPTAAATGFRSALAVPLIREGKPIGVVGVGRAEPGPFADKQIALLQTFADQAVIAIENVRLFKELEARNADLTKALEQQTATSEILRVISQSQTDAQPVFETIAAASLKLCGASSALVTTFDGDLIHLVATANVNPEGADAVRQAFPMPPGRSTGTSRAVLTGNVVAVRDVLEDHEYAQKPAALAGDFRSILAVPLLRESSPIGAIAVGRPNPGSFPDKQIALLQTFADQAVIAIENVRLFKELETRNRDLTEALEQQTATSEILRVISQSPTDVQPVFDTIVAAALKLCGASSANVYTFDGELIHLGAIVGANSDYVEALRQFFPRPPSRETGITRAILTCSVVEIPDVLADREYPRAIGIHALAGNFRSVLAVPLVRDGSSIGAIAVGRPEPGPFPDKQIALLQTFADQAVIAIENVRLFNETKEALEQQTATGDILSAISRSQTDAQPVFETIAAAALKLCSASSATVTRFDGELLHLAALAVADAQGADAVRKLFPRPPSRDITASRAIFTGSVVAIPDVLQDRDFADKASAVAGGFRSTLSVPLIREGAAIGAVTVGRPEPGPFSHKQVALLKTFADQAVIAIENARLVNELEARTTQLTRSVGELQALGEVGQAVSSTLDLETVLRTIVSRATALAGVDAGAIYEYDEAREEFYLHTANRLPDELVDALRAMPIRKGEGALGQMAVTREPVQIQDITDEGIYQSRIREILIRLGYRSLLAIPLLREDHLLGGLVVNRKSAGDFAPQVIELLKTFATQSALAIQNARLFRQIEEKSRQVEVASRHKNEFLANMSHELRTPLNAIIGFSEVLLERLFGELNDKQADYLNDIHSSGRHLLSLINDILDLAKIEAGRMELEPSGFELSDALANAMSLVRERAQQHGIVMSQQMDAELGAIVADQRKVKQILVNLLSNAVKFTPDGGRIDVRVRREDGNAVIAVHDTGIGIAPEDQAAVFEEFRQVGRDYTHKQEGTGLGLALTKKFVELHGGRIWLESELGKGSTFTFTIPLTP